MNEIDKIIAKVYEIPVENLYKRSRIQECCEPRQIAIYLQVEQNVNSYCKSKLFSSIAERYGLKRAGVYNCLKRVENWLDTDKHYRIRFQKIKENIK